MDKDIENGKSDNVEKPTSLAARREQILVNEWSSTRKTISQILEKIKIQGQNPVFLTQIGVQKQKFEKIYQSLVTLLDKVQEENNIERGVQKMKLLDQRLTLDEKLEGLSSGRKNIADDVELMDTQNKIADIDNDLKQIRIKEVEEELVILNYELGYSEVNQGISTIIQGNKENNDSINRFSEKKRARIKVLEKEFAKAKGLLGKTSEEDKEQEKIITEAEISQARRNLTNLREQINKLELKKISVSFKNASEEDLEKLNANLDSLKSSAEQTKKFIKSKEDELREPY